MLSCTAFEWWVAVRNAYRAPAGTVSTLQTNDALRLNCRFHPLWTRVLLLLTVWSLSSSALFAAVAALGSPESVPQAELDDFAARLQFAYYSEDVRSLKAALAELEQWQAPADSELLYRSQLAYGYWKLAELLSTADKSAGADSAGKCGAAADRIIAAAPSRGTDEGRAVGLTPRNPLFGEA